MSWILEIAGGVFSAVGTKKTAKANVRELSGQAASVNAETDRDVDAQRRRARQVLGTMAAAGAQNGGIDEGTLEQSALAAELDALNIQYGGRARSAGLLREARGIAKEAPWLAAAQLLSSSGSALRTREATKK